MTEKRDGFQRSVVSQTDLCVVPHMFGRGGQRERERERRYRERERVQQVSLSYFSFFSLSEPLRFQFLS